MALQLTDAISDGSRRVVTRTGGVLFAALLVSQLLLVTSLNTLIAARLPPEAPAVVGLLLPVSETLAGIVLFGTLVLSAVYFVVLGRAFSRPLSELSTFPAELYTRRIGRATVTMLVAGLVVSVAITVGIVLFFVPGIFLAACFLFVVFTVGVEDRGVVGALRRSWSLSKGNRLRLSVVVFLIGVCSLVVSAAPAVLELAGATALADLVSVVLNSLLFTFVYAIIAAAYRQVTETDGEFGGPSSSTAGSPATTPEL